MRAARETNAGHFGERRTFKVWHEEQVIDDTDIGQTRGLQQTEERKSVSHTCCERCDGMGWANEACDTWTTQPCARP